MFRSLFNDRRRGMVQHALRKGNLDEILRKNAEPIVEKPVKTGALSVLVPSNPGAGMREAIGLAEKAGKKMASNKQIDDLIVRYTQAPIEAAFPCWTGTLIAYVEPGITFREASIETPHGPSIAYREHESYNASYQFLVPEKYLDVADAALVAEPGGYCFREIGYAQVFVLYPNTDKIDLVEGFPAARGYYPVEPRHGMPYGAPLASPSIHGCKLVRNERRYVGLVCRVFNPYDPRERREMYVTDTWSRHWGVVVVD